MEPIFSSNYLPEIHDRQKLTADLADIVDQLMLTFMIEYRDVFDKYRSFFTSYSAGFQTWADSDLLTKLQDTDKVSYLAQNAVDLNSVIGVINEFGYSYIYNLLVNYREDEAQMIHYAEQAKAFLSVIHLLKGHKIGLLLVMGLLGITSYTTEWWELVDEAAQLLIDADPTMRWEEARAASAGVAEPDTYQLKITAGIPSSSLIASLRDFSRQYVYPLVDICVEQLVLFDRPFVWVGFGGEVREYFTSADKWVLENGYVQCGMAAEVRGYFANEL